LRGDFEGPLKENDQNGRKSPRSFWRCSERCSRSGATPCFATSLRVKAHHIRGGHQGEEGNVQVRTTAPASPSHPLGRHSGTPAVSTHVQFASATHDPGSSRHCEYGFGPPCGPSTQLTQNCVALHGSEPQLANLAASGGTPVSSETPKSGSTPVSRAAPAS
jgi:hypothetical protein